MHLSSPHTYYMPNPSHCSWFDHLNNIWWRVQVIKFSSYLIPLRPKYLPQHPILKHPQAMFVPQFERPSFTSIQKIDKIIVLYVLIRIFMDNRLEDKRFSTKWQQAFPDFNLIFTQDPVLYGRKVLKWIWIEWVTVEVDLSVSG